MYTHIYIIWNLFYCSTELSADDLQSHLWKVDAWVSLDLADPHVSRDVPSSVHTEVLDAHSTPGGRLNASSRTGSRAQGMKRPAQGPQLSGGQDSNTPLSAPLRPYVLCVPLSMNSEASGKPRR